MRRITVFFLIFSFILSPIAPVYALRVSQPESPSARAGLEESLEPFGLEGLFQEVGGLLKASAPAERIAEEFLEPLRKSHRDSGETEYRMEFLRRLYGLLEEVHAYGLNKEWALERLREGLVQAAQAAAESVEGLYRGIAIRRFEPVIGGRKNTFTVLSTYTTGRPSFVTEAGMRGIHAVLASRARLKPNDRSLRFAEVGAGHGLVGAWVAAAFPNEEQVFAVDSNFRSEAVLKVNALLNFSPEALRKVQFIRADVAPEELPPVDHVFLNPNQRPGKAIGTSSEGSQAEPDYYRDVPGGDGLTLARQVIQAWSPALREKGSLLLALVDWHDPERLKSVLQGNGEMVYKQIPGVGAAKQYGLSGEDGRFTEEDLDNFIAAERRKPPIPFQFEDVFSSKGVLNAPEMAAHLRSSGKAKVLVAAHVYQIRRAAGPSADLRTGLEEPAGPEPLRVPADQPEMIIVHEKLIPIEQDTRIQEGDTLVRPVAVVEGMGRKKKKTRYERFFVRSADKDGSVVISRILSDGSIEPQIEGRPRERLIAFGIFLEWAAHIDPPGGMTLEEAVGALSRLLGSDDIIQEIYFAKPSLPKTFLRNDFLRNDAHGRTLLSRFVREVIQSPVGSQVEIIRSGPSRVVVRRAAAVIPPEKASAAGLEEDPYGDSVRELKREDPEGFRLALEQTRMESDRLNLGPRSKIRPSQLPLAALPGYINMLTEGGRRTSYYAGDASLKEMQAAANSAALALAADRLYPAAQTAYRHIEFAHSVNNAVAAAFAAAMKDGDPFMSIGFSDGGHTSGGMKGSMAYDRYAPMDIPIDPSTREIDYAQLLEKVTGDSAKVPRLIYVAPLSVPRPVDFKRLSEVLDWIQRRTDYRPLLVANVSQHWEEILGKDYYNPFPWADVVIASSGMAGGSGGADTFVKDQAYAAVNRHVGAELETLLPERVEDMLFYYLQSSTNSSQVAVQGSLNRWRLRRGDSTSKQIKKNAEAFADALQEKGLKLVGGKPRVGYIMVIPPRTPVRLTAEEAVRALEEVGIDASVQSYLFRPKDSPDGKSQPGSAVWTRFRALTSQGMREPQMRLLAALIVQTWQNIDPETGKVYPSAAVVLREGVRQFARRFEMYPKYRRLWERIAREEEPARSPDFTAGLEESAPEEWGPRAFRGEEAERVAGMVELLYGNAEEARIVRRFLLGGLTRDRALRMLSADARYGFDEEEAWNLLRSAEMAAKHGLNQREMSLVMEHLGGRTPAGRIESEVAAGRGGGRESGRPALNMRGILKEAERIQKGGWAGSAAKPSVLQGVSSMDALPVWSGGGKVEPASAPGYVPTFFTGEQGSSPVSLTLWGLPVPKELLRADGSLVYPALTGGNDLHSQPLENPALDANAVAAVRRVLRNVVGTAGIRYRKPPVNGALGEEVSAELVPACARIYRPGNRAGSPQMEVEFAGSISAGEPVDHPFTAVIRQPDGTQFRFNQKGWIRVVSWSELSGDLSSPVTPLRMKQGTVPGGQPMNVVLLPDWTNRLAIWKNEGLVRRAPYDDTERVLDRMVDLALRKARPGRRTAMGADVGKRAGAFHPRADIVDPEGVSGLLPLDNTEGTTDWIQFSGEEGGKGIWTGMRLNRGNTEFVVEGAREEVGALLEQAKKVVNDLNKDFPDYNAWVVVGEDGTIRLSIIPRPPEGNDGEAHPVAPQEYRVVDQQWDRGQYRFVSRREIARVGWRHLAPSGSSLATVKKGDPLLGFPIDVLALQGLVLVDEAGQYEDGRLAARMEKALPLAGAGWQDVRIRALRRRLISQSAKDPKSAAREKLLEVVSKIDGVRDPQGLIDLVKEMRRLSGRYERMFSTLPPEVQNRFTRTVRELVSRFHEESPSLVEIVPVPMLNRVSLSVREGIPALVGISMPTLDQILEVKERGSREALVVREKAGGSTAYIVQTIRALDGIETEVVMMGGGETGERIRSLLAGQGIPVAMVEGPENRSSDMLPRLGAEGSQGELRVVAVGSEQPLTAADIRRCWAQAGQSARGRKRVNLFGERLPGPPEEQGPAAQEIANQIREEAERGNPTVVSFNHSWSRKTGETILGAGVPGAFFTLEGLAKMGGRDAYLLRQDSEKAALLAHRLRVQYGIRRWVLVSLGTGGLILVNDEGWWHVTLSPLLGVSQYTSGAADAAFGAFLLRAVLLKGNPVQAAVEGMTAAGIYLKRDPKLRGTPPTADEVKQAALLPRVEPLPIPRTVREQMKRERDAMLDSLATPHPRDAFVSGTGRLYRDRTHLTRREQTGLEEPSAEDIERRVSRRLEELAEARTGRGVLVIPADSLGRFAGLEEFLRQAPPGLSRSVVVWGKSSSAERLLRENSNLRSFDGENPFDFAVYLAGLEEAEQIGVLESPWVARALEGPMRAFGISVRVVPWNLTMVAEVLGIPREVSDQVGLEELAGDLFTQRGT